MKVITKKEIRKIVRRNTTYWVDKDNNQWELRKAVEKTMELSSLGFYTDENNNTWNIDEYTSEQALAASKTMFHCYNCHNSENCKNCFGCVNCKNCTDCDGCVNCYKCRHSVDCINCVDYMDELCCSGKVPIEPRQIEKENFIW